MAHLWQSTAFAALVWLATIALRQQGARVRYWLWAAASLKFLVPVSWLVALGAQIEWRSGPARVQPAAAFVIDRVFAPASLAATGGTIPTALASAPFAPASSILPMVVAAWVAGVAVVCVWWWRQWLPIRDARRTATPVRLESAAARGLTVMSSPMTLEPGVVGLWRPVLLVPEGLLDQLTPAQVDALLAHERSHVRHRDNLIAAVHMAVEALFWFHPLVWWIERRLIDERERACDEDVLRAGSAPIDYAEGILAVCRLTVRAPLACVAGVTGSDLRRRIESILAGRIIRRMSAGRRCVLAVIAVAAVALPVVVGAVNAVPLATVAQEPSTPVTFSVASVKANKSGERGGLTNDSVPGVFTGTNVWVDQLIWYAYEIRANQLDSPAWTRTLAPERFDVTARLDQIPAGLSDAQAKRLAMRSLLAERFHLTVRRELREVSIYALVMARADGRLGPKLERSTIDCSPDGRDARIAAAAALVAAGKPVPPCGMRVRTGRIDFGGYPLSWFAKEFSYDKRTLLDRTGLTGNWQFELTFAPDPQGSQPPGPDAPITDPNASSLPAALQEQLGLKLEPAKGTIEVLVVEHVERPTEN
jgi:uncharacterized protein (TIGR03435 family)